MKPNPQILSRLFTGMSRITPPTSSRKWINKYLKCLAVLVVMLTAGAQVSKAAPNFSGSGTSSSPYIIANKTDLLEFGKMYSENTATWDSYRDKYFRLDANITLENSDNYIPAGSNGNNSVAFTGTFDGNNKTISKINFTSSEMKTIGFIGLLAGTIKDLTINNSTFISTYNGTSQVAAIAGKISAGASIINCDVNNCTISGGSGSTYVGGIVGQVEQYADPASIVIRDCDVKGNTSIEKVGENPIWFGAIIGTGFSYATLSNNYYEWTVKRNGNSVAYDRGWGVYNGSYIDTEGARVEPVNSWAALKRALSVGVTGDGVITLAANCTDPSPTTDSYLNVPQNTTVVLNLNGKTINRNLTTAIENGYVIYNRGTLTINGSGTITGGKNTSAGGGIYDYGTLTINGGSITGNTALKGGGIFEYYRTATVTINGASITNNSATDEGGGIHMQLSYSSNVTICGGSTISNNSAVNKGGGIYYVEGTLKIKGKVTISGNTKGEDPNNVDLSSGKRITIDDNLDSETRIGVYSGTIAFPRYITSGLSSKGVYSYFTSDDATYAVRPYDDNNAEACLKRIITPTVSMSGWTYGSTASNPQVSNKPSSVAVTYTYKAEGESEFTSTKPTNAGTHTVKATTAETSSYTAGEATTTYTVSKATLTIFEATATAEYGTQVKYIPVSATALLGQTEVAGSWAFPSDNTTVPSVSSTTAYTATFTPTTGAGNYNALTTNITPTITQKAVTVSGITASNKTYDGNTTATLVYTNASFAGKVGGDDLSVSATGQFASKDVGTDKTVTISNLVLAGASAGNYTIESSSQSTTKANISKKDVTVSGIIASNKVYDGTNTATTTSGNASFSGLVSGDALTVSTSGTFNDANVGTGKAVTISILSLGGTSADNYKLAASGHQTETTANITQKPLTITAKDQAISYGTTIATGTGQVTTDGLVDGDALTTVELTASTSDYTTNGTITPSDATTTNGIGNYAVTYTPGALTIGKVVLTITAKDKTITYGDAPANDGVTYSGFIGTDDEMVLGGTLAYDYSYAQYDNVGDDYTITPKGLTSNNYTITFANGTLTVNPKAATVTPKDGQGKTYGEDDATLTYTSTGLVNGDVFTGALSRAAGEDVGNYAITQGTITNANNPNYTITFTTGKTFKIDPKTVGITWGETLLTYSGTAQAPEATATGLEDGDDCRVIVTGAKTEVGTYTATASSLDNANYKLPATGLSTDYEIVDQLVLAFAADQQWATWYGVNNYQVPAGMKAYKVTAVSDTKVMVDAINYIPATTGVLLYREATDAATAKSNAYTGATSSITSLLKSGSPTPYKDYILHGNQFVLSAVSEIGVHRCYLPATGASGSRSLDIDTGDGTTGIYFGYQDASEHDRWYDLQGNRIEKPQKKGLFILNGKKVVVK